MGRPFDMKPGIFSDSQTILQETLKLPPEERTQVQLYEVASILGSNGFLSKFSGSDQLIELARYMELRTYKPNTKVFSEGDPGDCFYIIHRGRVSLFKDISGEHTKLKELGKGNSFGEISLITGDPRTADVFAVDHTELITLDKDCFDRTIKNSNSQHIADMLRYARSLSS